MYLIKKIEGCTFIYRILLQLIIPLTIINISVLLKDSNYIIKINTVNVRDRLKPTKYQCSP
jgi:ribosomal protein L33